jgi:predicted nuclease of restriction endonuclease-like (RecB) superfamily
MQGGSRKCVVFIASVCGWCLPFSHLLIFEKSKSVDIASRDAQSPASFRVKMNAKSRQIDNKNTTFCECTHSSERPIRSLFLALAFKIQVCAHRIRRCPYLYHNLCLPSHFCTKMNEKRLINTKYHLYLLILSFESSKRPLFPPIHQI